MTQFFRIEVNEQALTDALFEFVTDPSATNRNDLPVINVVHEMMPGMVSVLECMVIDGVDQRQYVADYVHAVVHDKVEILG
ncbi:MAG: hypothetical protein ACYDER_08825 [Ktedonobacteraceae bacterium]